MSTDQNRLELCRYRLQQAYEGAVISYFDREFVKPGMMDKKFSKWLHRLFDLRQDADYGDMLVPTERQAHEALAQAEEFVQRIKKYHEEYSSE